MNLVAESNAAEYSQALREFIRYYGVEIPKALRHQSRLLAQEVLRKTPSKTRAQGRRAVARDIKRAVRPIRPQDFDSKAIRALIRKRDYPALKTVFSRFPEDSHFRKVAVVPFSPTLHSEVRDRRGRVQSFKGKVTPDYEPVRDYIAQMQTHVGQGKGGWAASLVGLGGRPAGWIIQHARAGKFQDHTADPVRGYVQMTNESEWAGAGDEDRVVSDSLRSRSVAILKALERAQALGLKRSFGP